MPWVSTPIANETNCKWNQLQMRSVKKRFFHQLQMSPLYRHRQHKRDPTLSVPYVAKTNEKIKIEMKNKNGNEK